MQICLGTTVLHPPSSPPPPVLRSISCVSTMRSVPLVGQQHPICWATWCNGVFLWSTLVFAFTGREFHLEPVDNWCERVGGNHVGWFAQGCILAKKTTNDANPEHDDAMHLYLSRKGIPLMTNHPTQHKQRNGAKGRILRIDGPTIPCLCAVASWKTLEQRAHGRELLRKGFPNTPLFFHGVCTFLARTLHCCSA